MPRYAASLVVIASLAAPRYSALPAQSQNGERPPRKITAAPAEFPQPFSVVRAVMALPDGRLVVSDAEENKLRLIDFAKGTAVSLSRIGQGPQEYRTLGGLYRARGGGVLVFDQGQRRLLPITATGSLQDVIALPIPGSSSSGGSRPPDPYAADSLGNAAGAERGTRAIVASDSMPLTRFLHGMTSSSITMLAKQPEKLLESSGNMTRSQMINFAPKDAWVMAPDGDIAVVRAKPYRLEWFPLTGPPVVGATVTYSPVRVTKADRDELVARIGKSPGTASIGMGGRGGNTPPPAPRPMPAELLFADLKAPFNAGGGHWPILDEQGRIWVERFRPAGTSNELLDVFDRHGVLIDRVELPAGSRLVGFDRQWLYAVRTDDDDLEHLQRFPLTPR